MLGILSGHARECQNLERWVLPPANILKPLLPQDEPSNLDQELVTKDTPTCAVWHGIMRGSERNHFRAQLARVCHRFESTFVE